MLRPTAGAVLVLSAALGAQAPGTRLVGDAVSCPRCTIVVRPLATLGTAEGPGSLSGSPDAVGLDGRGRYWIVPFLDLPMLFESTGRFVQTVGRKGEGPGEFMIPRTAVALPGDSVLVIDDGTMRATVMSPDLRPARTVSIRTSMRMPVAVRWPDAVIVNAAGASRAAPRWPLHRVSFAGSDASILESFGSDSITVRTLREGGGGYRIAANAAGNVWVADEGRYRIVEWTPAGRALTALERRPSWFREPSTGGIGTPATPPPPSVVGVQEDRDGLLWVFVRVAAPTWREAWPRNAENRREVGAENVAYERFFRTNVEVIDPKAARVVARRVLDRWVIAALPGGRVASYVVDSEGYPRVAIDAVSLTTADRRQ